MNVFTYKDYIKCIHTLRLNAAFKLAEESSRYGFTKDNVESKKIIKNIVKDAKEFATLINDFLDTNKKVDTKDLFKYDTSYICSKYRIDESKLIYKLRNKEIFFLVDEVFELDNIILYEILNYCISLMQEWNISNKIRGESKYPVIVPILIYSGIKKVNNKCVENKNQIGDYIFRNYNIKLNYNLIDINKISIEYLLRKNSLVAYGIILEKSKDKSELHNNLTRISEIIKDDIKFNKLISYINM